MSVYRPKGSPYYQYDFQRRGHRHSGSTKRTSEREAKAVEKAERDRVDREAAASAAATTSLQLADVGARYWQEVGQHHVGHKDTWRGLELLIEFFGPTRLLGEILDDDVARLVAWRRGHRVTIRSKKKPTAEPPLIANATVNRSTTEVLKKLFTRARKSWGARFDHEPNWTQHWLAEPEERVRELMEGEGDRLEEAARDDYGPFFGFAATSGLRLRECILRWPEVDWEARQIRKKGKGGKLVTAPITPAIRAILWPLRGQHAEFVFTYVAMRTKGPRIKGQRQPITYSGAKTQWKRLRARPASPTSASTTCGTTSAPSCCARPATSSWCRRRSTTATSRPPRSTPMSWTTRWRRR
jgi:hypothetical protein